MLTRFKKFQHTPSLPIQSPCLSFSPCAMSDPLEDLITASLSRLSLRNDEDVVAFVKELTEEESFEPEDRKSAILGMLELDEDDGSSFFFSPLV